MAAPPGECDLASKHCVPCEGGEGGPPTLDRASAAALQAQLQEGWAVEEDPRGRLRLRRNWRAASFKAGLELCRRFGEVAEEQAHHPDLHLTGKAC
jgi:4a-hydroxytetrahydrobiopterin dehydratase